MKLPETKMNIDDILISMDGHDIIEWRIILLKCIIDKNFTTKILYGLEKVATGYEISIYETDIGKNYFNSKKELFMHYFGDCLTEGLVVK